MYVADLVTVATGDFYTYNFKHYSLEVHLGPRTPQMIGKRQIHQQQVVVAGDDVQQLCCVLPRICYNDWTLRDGWEWIKIKVDVELNVRSNVVAEDGKDSCDNDPPLVKQLLEPFRQLYGYNVTVEGHVTTSYKKSIEASAAEPPPNALDVVCIVSKGRDEGNEARQKGSLGIAMSRYQSALDFMTSAYNGFKSRINGLAQWEIPDKSDLIAMDILQVSLRSTLAETYLTIGEFAKSYGCAQDLNCWYLFDDRADIPVDAHIPAVPDLVRMMFCKALAGKALGEPAQALRDIDEALRYSPNDEAMEEERKVLCRLVRKKIHSDVRMTWARGLNARTGKLKKPNKSKKKKRSIIPQPLAKDYSLAGRKDLEELMDKKDFA